MAMGLIVFLGEVKGTPGTVGEVIFAFGLLSCALETGRLVGMIKSTSKFVGWANSARSPGLKASLVTEVENIIVPAEVAVVMSLAVILFVVVPDILRERGFNLVWVIDIDDLVRLL